jgi:hypothetical protein
MVSICSVPILAQMVEIFYVEPARRCSLTFVVNDLNIVKGEIMIGSYILFMRSELVKNVLNEFNAI